MFYCLSWCEGTYSISISSLNHSVSDCASVCKDCVFDFTRMHTPSHFCALVRSISVCRHHPVMVVVKYRMALWYLTLLCFGVILSLVLLTKRIW